MSQTVLIEHTYIHVPMKIILPKLRAMQHEIRALLQKSYIKAISELSYPRSR